MHEDHNTYGSSGHKWADLVRSFNTKDILDYGCGKRTLEKKLGFEIQNYDPAIPAHEAQPKPAELVFCGDVLEHIEPEKLDAVLKIGRAHV